MKPDRLILVDSVTPVPEGFTPELAEVGGILLEKKHRRRLQKNALGGSG